jgi:YD repeat-containing protein
LFLDNRTFLNQNLTRMTEAQGMANERITTYNYDTNGNLLTTTLAGTQAAKTTMAYDASGNVTSILCCSAITIGEICSGMKDEERYNTEILLNSLKVISVDRRIAEHAGHYGRTMKGHTLELDDCIIAATCIVAGAPLITGNAKRYPMGDIEKMIIPGKYR